MNNKQITENSDKFKLIKTIIFEKWQHDNNLNKFKKKNNKNSIRTYEFQTIVKNKNIKFS